MEVQAQTIKISATKVKVVKSAIRFECMMGWWWSDDGVIYQT